MAEQNEIMQSKHFGKHFSSAVISVLQENWDEVEKQMEIRNDELSEAQSRELRRRINHVNTFISRIAELTFYEYD